jgi:hypothetical protein
MAAETIKEEVPTMIAVRKLFLSAFLIGILLAAAGPAWAATAC